MQRRKTQRPKKQRRDRGGSRGGEERGDLRLTCGCTVNYHLAGSASELLNKLISVTSMNQQLINEKGQREKIGKKMGI